MLQIGSSKSLGQFTCSLEVDIVKSGDRYEHTIWLRTESQRLAILQTVEGDDQDHSPPSPPIQDASVEDRAQSQVALGVGMAGTSHWSISMEAIKNQGHIEIDVACTPRATAPCYQSTYRLGPAVVQSKVDQENLHLTVNLNPESSADSELNSVVVKLSPKFNEADPACDLELKTPGLKTASPNSADSEAVNSTVSSDNERLVCITPPESKSQAKSGRWIYQISLLQP